jgi:hypothetical protein
MLKNTIGSLLLLAFTCAASFAQSRQLAVQVGVVNFSTEKTPQSQSLTLPDGSIYHKTTFEIRDLKAPAVQLAFKKRYDQRLAVSMAMNASHIKASMPVKYSGFYVKQQYYAVDTPFDRELWFSNIAATLHFDLLKDDQYSLELGAGPALEMSKFTYYSYTEFQVVHSFDTELQEERITTLQRLRPGYTICMNMDIEFKKPIVLLLGAAHNRFGNNTYTFLSMGVGWKLADAMPE